jgi:hypothetical protein
VILLRFGRRVDHGLGVNDHVQVLQEARQGAVVVRERPPNKAEVFVHRAEGGYRQAHLHHTLGLRVPELTETDHQVVDLLPQRRSYGRTGVRNQHAQRGDEFFFARIGHGQHVLEVAAVARIVRLRNGPAPETVRPVLEFALCECWWPQHDVVILLERVEYDVWREVDRSVSAPRG